MKIKNSGIYIIRCLKSIKVYIGSTIDIEKRKEDHLKQLKNNKHQRKLQNAYNKYGKENFIFEVLEYVEDKTKLIEREQFYLDTLLFASEDNSKFDKLAFNLNKIAGSVLGYKFTKEQKLRVSKIMSKILTGKKFSKKHKENISKSLTGRIISIKQKTNMSISAKNKIFTEEHRKNLSKSKIGKLKTQEHKDKISKSKKGVFLQKLECENCNKSFDPGNYAQHHGDNCKFKQQVKIA